MTITEAVEKYQGIDLLFQSYYKYSFSFHWENEEVIIDVSNGWSSDDIYKYTVERNTPQHLHEYWSFIEIKDKTTNKVIFSYDNF